MASLTIIIHPQRRYPTTDLIDPIPSSDGKREAASLSAWKDDLCLSQ
jgi:hypothetical protein